MYFHKSKGILLFPFARVDAAFSAYAVTAQRTLPAAALPMFKFSTAIHAVFRKLSDDYPTE